MPAETPTFAPDSRLRPALIRMWLVFIPLLIWAVWVEATGSNREGVAVAVGFLVLVPAVLVSYLSIAVFSQAITRNPALDDRERRRLRILGAILFCVWPPLGPTIYYVNHGADPLPPRRNPSLSFLER